MSSNPITLGCVAKDQITGFQGICVADTKWLNGCRRITIQPQELKEGKPIETVTFDIEQLDFVAPPVKPAHKPAGGPMPDPVR